jgi:hypothetical protein
MVVSLVVGAAAVAAGSTVSKASGISAGLGAATLANSSHFMHGGLVAASLQPHLAPTYVQPISNLFHVASPYHGALPNAGYVSYYYNHTWYGASWTWPYPAHPPYPY